MSKTKGQCIDIINKNLNNIKIEDRKTLLKRVEDTIIDITNSEYSRVWLYNKRDNTIDTFSKNRIISLLLEESILKNILISKRGFFDNYIVSHKQYNQKIDNPLNIKIKSMIIVPILDKIDESVIAFVVAYNSVKHTEELRRYDIRSVKLLENPIYNIIRGLEKEIRENSTLKKVEIKESKRKASLESELNLYKQKIIDLEKELLSKEQELIDKESQNSALELLHTVIEEDNDRVSEINTILNFLTNETIYLAQEEHKIYLFLEIIKNSLHNKEQLGLINYQLEKSHLIEKMANDLYKHEKMPLASKEFNIYQLINDIGALYCKTFAKSNTTLNIFVNPKISTHITLDIEKLKSLIIHLINNIFNFIDNMGAVELNIDYSSKSELLSVEVKGLIYYKPKKIKDLFSQKDVVSHSLTSSDNGLGLSISSNLVNIMGGKLKLSTIGKEEQTFLALIPAKQSKREEEKNFNLSRVIKVAILMQEENHYAVKNLIKQLVNLGVNQKLILTFYKAKEINEIDFSHLFCFEDLLSSEIKIENFTSVTILKYYQNSATTTKSHKNRIHELYINSYYGLALQEILFPNNKIVKLEEKTLLVEESFLSKFNTLIKKLKIS